MKREIRFRAWDEDSKTMLNPIDLSSPISTYDWLGKKDVILMQYTGLNDKNGKEIFEGDFVQHDAWDYPFEVFFHQEKARFVCKMKTGLSQYIDYERLVVIGNIYENPELID